MTIAVTVPMGQRRALAGGVKTTIHEDLEEESEVEDCWHEYDRLKRDVEVKLGELELRVGSVKAWGHRYTGGKFI